MFINMKQGILYKTTGIYVKKHILTPSEKKLIGMLSNNKWITYEEINKFVYKNELTVAEVKNNVLELQKRFGIYASLNKYRAKIRDVIAIS